ncbi:MAG: protoglobin domain-containing protein [Nitrospirota bacterium]|nr:protoglobin domain-containing protein [Nitrospirota bacterium]
MRSFKEIKHDYRFTEEDQKRLAALQPLMAEHTEEIMSTLNLWFMGTRNALTFFTDETLKSHVFRTQKAWFEQLFTGTYENRFYEQLAKIGAAHMRRNVDVHYLQRAANIIRNTCTGILSRAEQPAAELASNIISVGKIIDISMNVIIGAYLEEEIRVYSPVYKVKSALLSFSERFSQATNFMLVFALIGLTLGIGWLFLRDVINIFSGGIEDGIISALGSMLLLWLMIELMNTEISHLKGGKFHISIFVGVALVTMIRETMIATLRHEKPELIYYLIAAILVIGFVYWIVAKTEELKK